MNAISPQSRVYILDTPVALPGHCVMCRASRNDDRKYVDFGMQLDFYGSVIFCTFCIRDVAAAVGFVPNTLLVEATHEYTNSVKENMACIDELRKKNEALTNALSADFDFDSVTSSLADRIVDLVQAKFEDVVAERNPAKDEPGASKTSSGQGPIRVRSHGTSKSAGK